MKKLLDGISVRCNVWNKPNDIEQARYLEPRGYKVIRFWNNDVMNNLESVLTVIWDALKEQKAKRTGKKEDRDHE